MQREIAEELEIARRKISDPAMLVAVTIKYYFLQSIDNSDWIEFTRCADLRHLNLQQEPLSINPSLNYINLLLNY